MLAMQMMFRQIQNIFFRINPLSAINFCFIGITIDFVCILLTFPFLKLLEYFYVYNSQLVLKILSVIETIIGLFFGIGFIYFYHFATV